MKKKHISILGFIIWSIASLFFFYEFFLRVFFGTAARELIQSLQLSASDFSIIGAGYYFAYSFMQVPVGIMVDRIKIKTLLLTGAISCTLGVFVFMMSYGFFMAFFSRFLIGFGSSFAFISLLYLALDWFPKEHFGFFSGLAQFLGAIGPIFAGGPLAYFLIKTNGNWRFILFWIGLWGIILILLIFFFVHKKGRAEHETILFAKNPKPVIESIKRLIRIPQVWAIIFCSATIYVSVALLAAYWGTLYLEKKGFDKTIAASLISIIWIGHAIGCVSFGKISDIIRRRKPILYFSSILGFLATCLLLYFHEENYIFISIILFCVGIGGAGLAATYPLIRENVPEEIQGTALGFNNSMVMLSGAIVPIITSYIIEFSTKGGLANYTIKDFTKGLSVMPILFILAFLISFFLIKETYCRSQFEIHKIPKIKYF